MTGFETLEVPEKCRGCATQETCVKRFNALSHIAFHAVEGAEMLMREEFETEVMSAIPAEDVTEFTQFLRQGAAEGLDMLDRMKEAAKQKSAAHELSCDGIFKMRAVKGDVAYTVNVCTSAVDYVRDAVEPQTVSVNIRATSANRN